MIACLIRQYGGQNGYDILYVVKENTYQPKILYSAELSFNNEGKAGEISDKGQVRGCVYKITISKSVIKRHA